MPMRMVVWPTGDEASFEDWMTECDFYDRGDLEGLLEFRLRRYAETGALFWNVKVGEALNDLDRHAAALEWLTETERTEPGDPECQFAILDALFALGQDETDFRWTSVPSVARADRAALDRIETHLRNRGRRCSLIDLFDRLFCLDYCRFSDEEMLEALSRDGRFALTELPGDEGEAVGLREWGHRQGGGSPSGEKPAR